MEQTISDALAAYTLANSDVKQCCRSDVEAALRILARNAVAAPSLQAQLLAALQLTLDALSPPGALFASDEYTVDSSWRTAFVDAAVPRLDLVCVLLSLLPQETLFPANLRRDDDSGAWPHGGEGVHDGGVAPGPRAAVLACSFTCGASLAADAAPSDGVPPWSEAAAVTAAHVVLDKLTHAFMSSMGGTSTSRLAMLAASLAARAPTLRQPLLPPDARQAGHSAHTNWDATVAAQTMRSVLCQLVHPHSTDVFPAVFPCLLLALEHSSSAPRTHGQLAALHVATSVTRTALRSRGPPLWQALLAGLPACELHAWPHAVRAAVAHALVLAGDDATASQLHQLIAQLTDELSLRAADTERATPMLAALPQLIQIAQIQMLRHTCRLVPLLCEWMACDDPDARALAASALTCLMEYLWPRAEHHVSSIWPALAKGCSEQGNADANDRGRGPMLRLAEQMHYAGGDAFARAWHAHEGALPDALGSLLRQLEREQTVADANQVEQVGTETLDFDAELAHYLDSDSRVNAILDEWAAGDSAALLRNSGTILADTDLGDLPEVAAMDAWLERLSLTSTDANA